MKIAFFTYLKLEVGGGVAKYFIETASTLDTKHSELAIDIITFDDALLRKILFFYFLYFFGKQDMHKTNKEDPKILRRKLKYVGYYKAKTIRQLKNKLQTYDVIYTTNNLLEIVLFRYLLRYHQLPPVIIGFHIPTVYTTPGSVQTKIHNLIYQSSFYFRAMEQAKRYHVLNNHDEVLLKKSFSPEKVFKIYNPFDFNEFAQKAKDLSHPSPLREPEGSSEPRTAFPLPKGEGIRNRNKTYILWVGRLTEQKGVNDLVAIINEINKNYKNNLIWTIVGEGEEKGKIMTVTKQWENVNYFGYIEQNYMPSMYQVNNLFINTSKCESFPYVLLEAQSFGLPVICYNIPGCNDIVKNEVNGYLVKDKAEMQQKIVQLLKSNTFNKRKIKKYIKSKFRHDTLYERLYGLLTNLT